MQVGTSRESPAPNITHVSGIKPNPMCPERAPAKDKPPENGVT
jgi:hypothetical protein